MGTLLAFLGSRVLGQYDPFGGPEKAGRLLLVAPNVVAARRALDVDAEDFALWVCLHEATHRLQFTAVDWLRDHFRAEVAAFAGGFDRTASGAVDRLPEIVKAVRRDPPQRRARPGRDCSRDPSSARSSTGCSPSPRCSRATPST